MISSTVIRQKSCEKNQNADEERKVAKLNLKKLTNTIYQSISIENGFNILYYILSLVYQVPPL